MSMHRLIHFFEKRREAGGSMVLITVCETQGSTYSKTGAQMLVDEQGIFQGMLSGGCLEGDLAIRAQVVIETGIPQRVSYDLSADDELWGLGVGCDGAMHVFLQLLTPADEYAPFAALVEALSRNRPAVVCTVLESSAGASAVGASGLLTDDQYLDFGLPGDVTADAGQHALRNRASQLIPSSLEDVTRSVLYAFAEPPPRLLILGAGLDVPPLLQIAAELGWRVEIADHRPAYLQRGDLNDADQLHCHPAAELAARLTLDEFDAAVAMSHHLESDRHYLQQLAASEIGYIGLLGPPHRRDRLLRETGIELTGISERLHAPVGLDLGGRGPAPIALSIAAGIQAWWSAR